jgi:hypothetical protein
MSEIDLLCLSIGAFLAGWVFYDLYVYLKRGKGGKGRWE